MASASAVEAEASAVGVRRQGRRKPAGLVPETGVTSLEDELRGGVHREYLTRHLDELLIIRNRLQEPPEGLFTHRDVRWYTRSADEEDIDLGLGDEGAHKFTRVTYIPWERVSDFKDGEERGRKDVETIFRRTMKNTRNKGDIKRVRWNVLIDSWRYECQHGPEDRSEEILQVHPDTVPKKRQYNSKEKAITSGEGQTGKRATQAQEGGSIKLGCTCRFYVKRYFFLPGIAEIVYKEPRHVNAAGIVVHGRDDGNCTHVANVGVAHRIQGRCRYDCVPH